MKIMTFVFDSMMKAVFVEGVVGLRGRREEEIEGERIRSDC